ncbi:MAG: HD domain-containing protein [bacterium]|nr:HD domain-containing protein [bacterium]
MGRRIRIDKRWHLVVLVVIGQTATLSLALVWHLGWLDDTLTRMFRQDAATIRFAGIAGSVILILLSGVVTAAIMRRYENGLAAVNADLESLVDRRSQALMKTRDAVIFGLAKLAESRDDETGEHLERIRAYVTVLARELCRVYPEIDDDTIAMLALTSSLHDIGKARIPDAVLLKPGNLDDQERAVIEKHTLIGGDCLLAIKRRLGEDDFLDIACEIALAHHERWDGSGYPFGLAGDQIPLSARIVAVADAYDALTTKRVYKDAMSHDKAREVIEKGSGVHFDPDVVAAFMAREEDFRTNASHLHGLFDPDQELNTEAVLALTPA